MMRTNGLSFLQSETQLNYYKPDVCDFSSTEQGTVSADCLNLNRISPMGIPDFLSRFPRSIFMDPSCIAFSKRRRAESSLNSRWITSEPFSNFLICHPSSSSVFAKRLFSATNISNVCNISSWLLVKWIDKFSLDSEKECCKICMNWMYNINNIYNKANCLSF